MGKEDHFHTIRVIKTLKGLKAYCVQPECAWTSIPEFLHRKLIECEVCFEHFLFDVEAWNFDPRENRILCWKCQNSPRIGMTLEQQQVLLEREIKKINLEVIAELEKTYQTKRSELQAHEKALELFQKELKDKEQNLQDRESQLKLRKKNILLLLQSEHEKLRARRIKIETPKVVIPKEPKVPPEPKAPKVSKVKEQSALDIEKKELQNAIFAALSGVIQPQTNEGTDGSDSERAG